MATSEPKCLIDSSKLDEIMMESDAFCASVSGHSEEGIVIAEWDNANHTHIALEVMGADGEWIPVSVVPLAACQDELNRGDIRQFPVFRLAWYGQLELPSEAKNG
jgi:hypothetical protein